VEEVEGRAYRRALAGGERLEVTVAAHGAVTIEGPQAVGRWMFALDRPAPDAALAGDPLLGPLVRKRPDLRVPGAADPFELAVRAVLGQQITVAAARGLAERIVAGCGTPLGHPSGALTHVFPTPEELLAADPRLFTMPAARRETLLALARAWPIAPAELPLVRGIGPWTAGYVALRSGRPDVFLPGDAGVRAALRRLGAPSDPGSAVALADRWRPYRSHAVVHLWASLAHAAPASPVAPA
jgi:AraC family transcriptional regulator, regulatory protein of adaptative response / DNA-3-methyladenine glycosylase II